MEYCCKWLQVDEKYRQLGKKLKISYVDFYNLRQYFGNNYKKMNNLVQHEMF